MEKRCYICLCTKPLSDFLNSSSKKDGKRSECRECGHKRNRERRKLWTPERKKRYRELESAKQANAKYRKTEKYKESARAGERRRRQAKYRSDPEYRRKVIEKLQRVKTPEKNYARRRLGKALKKGKIQRQPCACGNPRSHGHHEDYSKPLDVVWMCASCHAKYHHQKSLLNLDNY